MQLDNVLRHAAWLAVRGHGVSSECVQAQFRESQQFFALDLEEKLKIKVSSSMPTVLSISNKPPFLVGVPLGVGVPPTHSNEWID